MIAGASALTRKIVVPAMFAAAACSTHTPPKISPAFTRDLDAIFGAQLTEHALWGVEIKSLDTGRIWYSRNARTLLMPASNMKILTLAAAAQTLGWDYRFKTTLEAVGSIELGTLHGNLVVRGTGDPTINSRNSRAAAVFDEFANGLKAAGVNEVVGSVVGDDDLFDDVGLGQGWAWDYLEDGYAAPVGALEFNESVARLTITPGTAGEPAAIAIPPASGYQLLNHVVTGEAGSPNRIEIRHALNEIALDVTGSIAAGSQPVNRDVSVVNPTAFFAQSLRDALVTRGIAVHGSGMDIDQSRDAAGGTTRVLVCEIQSPPLRDIATTMMKVSQNLYAETLLKAVGAAKSGLGTAENGRAAARAVFASWNIATPYVQADGSGLSRYDFVSAEMLIGILEHMHQDPRHRDAFVATLPIAGKDGTVSTRMRATRAEANAIAKTGSIANVRALSGYVRTRDGELLAFSILANNFTTPAATITWMTDLAVETLANYSRR